MLCYFHLGSFITVDICTHSIEDTGQLDVLAVVQKLRSQRAFSIQTVDQYIFCHKALIEFCQIKGYGRDENAESNEATANGATCEEHATEAKWKRSNIFFAAGVVGLNSCSK